MPVGWEGLWGAGGGRRDQIAVQGVRKCALCHTHPEQPGKQYAQTGYESILHSEQLLDQPSWSNDGLYKGLTNHSILAPFLFQFFLLLYLVTIIGNIGMMTLVYTISPLHTPMYYFLANLALVDLLYSTTVTPKMLTDLVSKEKCISFKGCALQFYFYVALAVNEALLLTVMAYDRYIAICQPLHYISIMIPKRCIFIALLVFFIAFLQSSIQTTCVFHLQFCGPNIIEHFYCDLPPLLKLSCSETFCYQLF
ncbi:olfactory receptor 5M5-like [Discoglossus pictus]